MRWQSIGPSRILEPNGSSDVGRVTSIVIDPRFRGIVYAGARHSGLWKTMNGGASWFPLTDAMPTLSVDALAMDPENPDRLLMATPKGLCSGAGAVSNKSCSACGQARSRKIDLRLVEHHTRMRCWRGGSSSIQHPKTNVNLALPRLVGKRAIDG